MVVCRLKRNTEFRLNDAPNRASSSQLPAVNSHESNCAISETDIDQRGLSEQDKGVGCSSKRSSSSYGSPSVEQIDSASESNQKPPNCDTALTETSSHKKVHEIRLNMDPLQLWQELKSPVLRFRLNSLNERLKKNVILHGLNRLIYNERSKF